MASVNKVILIGNLGKDPELKYLASGQAVAEFSIATTDRWKDKDGNTQERTEWHNIILWGRMGETAKEYLSKGKSVYIEGRLQYRSWDDKDGNKRYRTEIIGDRMQFLGSRGDSGSRGDGGSGESGGQRESGAPRTESAGTGNAGSMESSPANSSGSDDDDLPF